MDVVMPDGTKLKGVPDNLSKEEVLYRYNQRKIKPEYSPTTEKSFLVGAGDTLSTIGRNAQKLYAGVTGDGLLSDKLDRATGESQRLMRPMEEQKPISTTIGRMAPGLATMPLSGGLLAQMGIGGALGAAQSEDDQGAGGLLGVLTSGVGYGVGKGISSMAKAVGGNVPPIGGEAGRLAARSDEIGMQVLPGQRMDSLPRKQLEASMKSNPAMSGVFEEGMKQNQTVINKLAAESIGEASDEISPAMLGTAADRIGAVYDNVAKSVDEVPIAGLQDFYNNLSFDSIARIENYAKRFPGLQTGKLTGEELSKLRQITQKDIRGAWQNLPSVAEDLQDFQLMLMKGLEDCLLYTSPSPRD